MRIQFLNNGSEFRSYGGGSLSKNKADGGLFWWTIFIFLLLALATVSWFFCIMVFSYPEKPFNYRLLTKLDKLEPLKKYATDKVPRGQFVTATKLLEDYSFFTSDRLRVTNEMFKRDYVRNYKEHAPVYVKGSFVVQTARPLAVGDVFTSGWIVVARSSEMEDVMIEYVLPGLESTEVPYHPGDMLVLDNKKTFASAIHLQKQEGDRMVATLVSLTYDSVTMPDGSIAKTEAPKLLNLDGTWPVWRDVKIEQPVEAIAKAVQVTAAQAMK
jgi:hypothetical protein